MRGRVDDDVDKVRRALEEALAQARRDWLLGTVLTVLFLPLLLAGAAVIVVGWLGWGAAEHVALGSSPGLATVEGFLGLLFLGFVLGEPGRTRWPMVGLAACVLVALGALAHGRLTPKGQRLLASSGASLGASLAPT